MRKLIVLGLLAGLALAALFALPAGAGPAGVNGQILFSRFDPAQGDTVIYTVNPDGSHEHQVLPFALECPHWSADGSRIVTCGLPDGSSAVIITPDTGSFREVFSSDPSLFLSCPLPSPDGQRLACEQWNQPADPSRNGIYSIRSSDGGGLERITSNPGGSDSPSDYSPNGKRLVFGRSDQNGDPGGLFVVNVNGTGLKQIMPAGTLGGGGNWSPQGNEIVFSQRVTPDVHSSIWVVHANGTDLHEIHVQPESACGGLNSDPTADGCFDPRWSPDGTKIIFAKGTSGDSDSNIYTVNVNGTGLTQVTHGGRDQAPDWGTHPEIG
jgi:Tol biopolymer transport system component